MWKWRCKCSLYRENCLNNCLTRASWTILDILGRRDVTKCSWDAHLNASPIAIPLRSIRNYLIMVYGYTIIFFWRVVIDWLDFDAPFYATTCVYMNWTVYPKLNAHPLLDSTMRSWLRDQWTHLSQSENGAIYHVFRPDFAIESDSQSVWAPFQRKSKRWEYGIFQNSQLYNWGVAFGKKYDISTKYFFHSALGIVL